MQLHIAHATKLRRKLSAKLLCNAQYDATEEGGRGDSSVPKVVVAPHKSLTERNLSYVSMAGLRVYYTEVMLSFRDPKVKY